MPYIKQEDRQRLAYGCNMRTAGELNFEITLLIQRYLDDHPGYSGINDIIGAIEGAKLEFYRRVAAPYEDKKIIENGDVYT